MSSEMRDSQNKKGKLTINMLNSDILNQIPLESLSVVDRYKDNDGDDPEIEKFRRFKEMEDKNKARMKAERRRQNRLKQEQEATLEQVSDEKKSKKPPSGKILGETLTTDYNGAPLEVRKITGGCLLKPLQGFCAGPEFLLDEQKEEE